MSAAFNFFHLFYASSHLPNVKRQCPYSVGEFLCFCLFHASCETRDTNVVNKEARSFEEQNMKFTTAVVISLNIRFNNPLFR